MGLSSKTGACAGRSPKKHFADFWEKDPHRHCLFCASMFYVRTTDVFSILPFFLCRPITLR